MTGDHHAYDLPALVTAWVHGWALSRRVPAPAAIPGGHRVDVGLPGHRVRRVLHTYDAEALARLALEHAEPGTWIKAGGDADEFHAALPAQWRTADTGYLMTAPFAPAAATPPDPYTLTLDEDGAVITARVLDADGGTAAQGQLAVYAAYAIVDQVETDPAHRRRGLGGTVMRALAGGAYARGARTGVLVATDEGRALYESLGWTWRSDVPGAYVPEE